MNTLQSNIAIAISKDIEINKENLITVSSSCTNIAIEYMGLFAEFVSFNQWHYNVIANLWWSEIEKDEKLYTSQLIQMFIKTL